MKLDGKWYQVDCTWDDTKDNYYNFDPTHLYFGLTDELMALAHNGHNKIYTASGYGTRSTSLADNYLSGTEMPQSGRGLTLTGFRKISMQVKPNSKLALTMRHIRRAFRVFKMGLSHMP